ncbi:cysteine hydrolase [Pedobacter psychrodurus]|uniref:Cysteine hydrolase n=1 Tax=Pedobacter psychrodurus TaxID=2530456 RepID=A0A4V2MQV3_9SPHI|nr:isochorismatase family cysteine hydrolase [Pedobacter psychrodurus]TCD26505.1 cysteine hydrolase [Pedobacter psychrodurus]
MTSQQIQKTALILIDPYNDFLSEGGKLWPLTRASIEEIGLIENLKKLVTGARANHLQVIYAPHRQTTKSDYLNWRFLSPSHQGSKKHQLFEKGSWGGEFHPDLVPKEGDLVAQNHWTASGFANTDLDFLLRMHGKENVVIAGMRANTCIDSSARYAVELGYHVTLIKDGIAAFNMQEVDVTVEVNFPSYGHLLLSTDEFIASIKS